MNKKKVAILAIAILLIAGWGVKKKFESSNLVVRTAPITSGGLNDTITLEGVVEPETEETIYAEVPVVVEKVELKVGAKVNKGDTILSFTGEAKKEIEKSLEEISIQVNTSEALLDTIKRQAKNAGFEAEVTAQQAKVNKELLDQDAISSIEVAKSVSMANKASSEYEDLKARGLVEEQKYNLLVLKQKDLEKKFKSIGEDLKAPQSGIVTNLSVENGTILRQGQKILSIAKEGNYKIKIEAPANLISSIKEGSEANVRDLSNGGKYAYKGNITKVSRVARDDAKKRKVIDIEVALENGEGLNPGFLTSVEIVGGFSDTAKLVDSFSVLEENERFFVYMVKDGVIEKVPVEIGAQTNLKYEILNLPVGTKIVINPSRVKSGQRVKEI
ncbi:MAG: HlyD family efflux transporter periplasmic adaptor subunit [Cetobacterium sp.]|uniref:efflux RND transporter periplasmic adaptor subunit n=1 Tax=Cetobacterium sp. TaxID=2071632 RepID=UPI002FCABFEE